MKKISVVILAGIIAAVVAVGSYMLFVAVLAAVIGPLAMLAFAVASHYSDGAIPAFGYVASSAIMYVLLLAAVFPASSSAPSSKR